jgi:hypothetical protein
VMPASFIPRVQVRRVARQGLHPDLAALARHELLDLPRRWMGEPSQITNSRFPATRCKCSRNSTLCSPLSDSCRVSVETLPASVIPPMTDR